MFGFQGGESAETISRKRSYMQEAQKIWPFLTNFDCSVIKTAGQLAQMIKTRSATTIEKARLDVDAWVLNKQF